MKIVIATPFYPPQIGVLANYAEGLERAFEEKGHAVAIVRPGNLQKLPPVIRHVAYFCRVFVALRGADFVLALDAWTVGYPAFYAARLRRVPFVIRIGGDIVYESFVERTKQPLLLSEFYTAPRAFSWKENLMRRLIGSMVRGAHRSFFNTRFQKEIWDRAYAIAPGRSALLENYYPEKSASVPSSNHIFVSTNRPSFFKNTTLLDRAFAAAKARHPEISLDTKPLPHAEQLLRFAASYAVIIPSISEVGSNIAIEAVTQGRPFIMSSDTGSKERLGDCGLFIDTRSEAAFQKAIDDILDPKVYAKLRGGIDAFSFTHSWSEIAEEIIQKL